MHKTVTGLALVAAAALLTGCGSDGGADKSAGSGGKDGAAEASARPSDGGGQRDGESSKGAEGSSGSSSKGGAEGGAEDGGQAEGPEPLGGRSAFRLHDADSCLYRGFASRAMRRGGVPGECGAEAGMGPFGRVRPLRIILAELFTINQYAEEKLQNGRCAAAAPIP